MMNETAIQIASKEKILQTIKRIAFEIAEDNYDEPEIVIAGIGKTTEGYEMASMLYEELKKISVSNLSITNIELDKQNPGDQPVELPLTEDEIDHKVIILVDDVANTGRTLLYAIKPFLAFSPKKIRIAVLVERKHKLFPVSPDYVGLSLSTTFQEHIRVVLSGEESGIYLS